MTLRGSVRPTRAGGGGDDVTRQTQEIELRLAPGAGVLRAPGRLR